jgi:hypothetical protein
MVAQGTHLIPRGINAGIDIAEARNRHFRPFWLPGRLAGMTLASRSERA